MRKSSLSPTSEEGLLAKNTIINLLGQGLPLLVALAAIPFVIDGLGTERFGVLTIVWIVIGYFGLFDMGIGRATTKFVADFQVKGERLSPLIITSILLLVFFGILGGCLIVLLTPAIVSRILNIPVELVSETTNAFYILSISIPFVLGSIGARGALEAQQKFALVNIIKVPASILNYVAPLLILPFTNSLHFIVIILVVGRAATFAIYSYYCLKDDYTFRLSEYPIVKWTKDLLSFGAWITVSNFISPLMVYMDRFILGAILTMSAVAYYTTPYEIVTRLLIISGSFMGVMFPAFSVSSHSDKTKLYALHKKSIHYILLAVIPLVTFLILSAEPLLYYWLGEEFSRNSTRVMQLLAFGVLANSIASVPYTAIQASGRPDITAKLHMVELPIYLTMIWFFTKSMGIEGVALAWVIRVSLDCGLLLFFFNKTITERKPDWAGLAFRLSMFGIVFLIIGFLFQHADSRFFIIVYSVLSAFATFWLVWLGTLNTEERTKVIDLYKQLKRISFSTAGKMFNKR